MDSSEERINFENMPRILAELRDRITSLEKTLTGSIDLSGQSPWMDISDLIAFLPTHPTPGTVYSWVRDQRIPYYRKGRLLYFHRVEIDAWLREKESKI